MGGVRGGSSLAGRCCCWCLWRAGLSICGTPIVLLARGGALSPASLAARPSWLSVSCPHWNLHPHLQLHARAAPLPHYLNNHSLSRLSTRPKLSELSNSTCCARFLSRPHIRISLFAARIAPHTDLLGCWCIDTYLVCSTRHSTVPRRTSSSSPPLELSPLPPLTTARTQSRHRCRPPPPLRLRLRAASPVPRCAAPSSIR